MSQVLDAIEIETAPRPDAAVMWLHGLGADGRDFEPIVPQLRLPAYTSMSDPPSQGGKGWGDGPAFQRRASR